MTKQHPWRGVIAGTLVLFLIVTMLIGLSWQVMAQDGGNGNPRPTGTPQAYLDFYGTEATYEGDAEWTFTDNTFQSNYPEGFTFTVQVASSAGDVVNARVIWSHNIGNRRSRPAEWNPETGIARLDYEPAVGESIPAWLAINYKWSFEDSEGNLFETEWILDEEYTASQNNWTRTESEDIIVFAEEGLPDNVGEMTVQAMAEQRETYRRAWGGLLPYKPRAILYSNRQSWAEWRVGETNPQVIGTTRTEWGAVVQVVSRNNVVDLAYGTVLHEVAHMYQNEFVGAFATGSWWNEGNATLFELHQQYDYEQRVRNLASMDELPTMLQGTGPGQNSRGPDGRNRLGYDTGYVFWKWIVENYGLDAHREIIQRWRSGGTRNEVLEEVLGLPADEIERRWRIWLGASPEAATPIPTPTFRIPPTQAQYTPPASD